MTSDKYALRRKFKEIRSRLSNTAADEIIRLLTLHNIWQSADTVLSYMPTRGELDISTLMQKALSDGKKFALPLTLTGAAEGLMDFRFVTLERDMKIGRFGICEPTDGCKKVSADDLENALCIVPALAFDTLGYRLGYGGGYYDRFLKNFTGISVGLVASELLLPSPLPREEYDVAVDYIITERQVLCINGR